MSAQSAIRTKVVQLSSVHPSYDTRIFHKICKSLVSEGYHVDLIIQHDRDEIKDGVNIVSLPIAKRKSDRIFKIFPKILKKILKYPRNTIVHFHDPELIPFGFIFKIFGFKVVYDVHEDVPADISCKDWLPKWLRKPLSIFVGWLELLAVKFFDGIVVVVNDVQVRLQSEKTYLIQNFPIIQTDLKEHKYQNEGYLFYVGDISKIRGVEEMINLVEDLSSYNKIEFVLAGKFSPEELKSEMELNTGWKKTKFVGWVTREELHNHFYQASLGLVLLYPEPHHVKSQPNKLFEYMYGGIPVLSSNLPRYKEIIDEIGCGITVDPLDRKSIYEGAKFILDNPDIAEEMGRKGRRAVLEKYNWDIEKKQLFNMYKRILLKV